KVLMLSGVGDAAELHRFGIEVAQHLPGVGRNLQDHPLLGGCVWEYERALTPTTVGPATLFWKSKPGEATSPSADVRSRPRGGRRRRAERRGRGSRAPASAGRGHRLRR